MEELNLEQWRAIASQFRKVLGESRVRLTDKTLILRFDTSNKLQFAEMNDFAKFAQEYHVKNTPLPSHHLNSPVVEVVIRLTNEIPQARRLVDHMSLLCAKKPNGEIHHPIVDADDAHVLEELTGVPWPGVKGSPYTDEVVEAVLPSAVDSEKRWQQELGVGLAIRPPKTSGADVDEWVQHQRLVEEKNGMPPRTMLPSDWVNGSAVSRARNADALRMRSSLAGVFKGK